jgi:serine/threonine protein kinase
MKTLGKYEVLEELGSGAMGKVFHGRDRVLQREVAIKTIATEDADVELKQRFYREARSCGRLSHPNIVTVFDLGEQQGTSYIAMEYLEGEDLRKFIDRKTFMPLEGKLQIMAEVADGLAHAHENRIVHRDIKPSNIFLLKSGRPKLLDFGIARVFASQLTRVGNALGTPEYMAPEQIKGKETDARSDIFSAAVVFFELLTHEHPFGESDIPRKVIQDSPKSLRSLNPLIPEKLEQILMRAMNKEQADRYQTAAEFAKALRKLSFETLGSCSKMTDEALAMLPLDFYFRFADGDLIRARELRLLLDFPAIDQRSITASQILDPICAVLVGDPRMCLRHLQVRSEVQLRLLPPDDNAFPVAQEVLCAICRM